MHLQCLRLKLFYNFKDINFFFPIFEQLIPVLVQLQESCKDPIEVLKLSGLAYIYLETNNFYGTVAGD